MGHGLYRTAALGAGVTSLSLVRTFCTHGAGSGRRERDTVGYRGLQSLYVALHAPKQARCREGSFTIHNKSGYCVYR